MDIIEAGETKFLHYNLQEEFFEELEPCPGSFKQTVLTTCSERTEKVGETSRSQKLYVSDLDTKFGRVGDFIELFVIDVGEFIYNSWEKIEVQLAWQNRIERPCALAFDSEDSN